MTVPEQEIEALLADHIRVVSGTDIGLDANFFAAGLNSAMLVALHAQLNGLFPRLLITEMFKYPTRRSLARFLAGSAEVAADGAPRAVRQDWGTSADSPDARRVLRARIRQRDS
jgi:hypothetical protein